HRQRSPRLRPGPRPPQGSGAPQRERRAPRLVHVLMSRAWAAPLLALLALSGACEAAGPEPDGARAHARVVRQVAMGPRIPGTPGHRAIREWIAAEIRRLHGKLEDQAFMDTVLGRPMELHNLIGRFGPEGRRIAFFAHYDTRAFSDQDPDSTKRSQP